MSNRILASAIIISSFTITMAALQTPSTHITTLAENGGRLDWSERLDLIAFDRLDGKYFNIYTMRPDGSNITCVTCGRQRDLPTRSKGNPAWHPSGDYIVFQAQNDYKGLGAITDYFANPGAGVNNDLWIMDRGGTRFWRITNLEPRIGGVLHPQFSPDGRKLFWSQRIDAKGAMGTWALVVADFVIGRDGPRIENQRMLQPGAHHEFYESHGFSRDGRQLLFSGNLEPGQDPRFGDIYLFDLKTAELKNLTRSNDQWTSMRTSRPTGRQSSG